jgi:hypothetical protein
MGIFADDLFIYRGLVQRNSMRKISYTIIEIPKLDRQVAVCDQIGEISFVATRILPIHTWAAMNKEELKSHPDVHTNRYGRHWIQKLHGLLLDEGKVKPATRPKATLRRKGAAPILTETQIVEWIRLYHEKEGKWPRLLSTTVWDKDEQDNWIEVKENWAAINGALDKGLRGLPGGSSLAMLKERHGFMDDNSLTEEKIVRWIRLFREKEGKWPRLHSTTVWDKDEQDNWIEVKENWAAINGALDKDLRGLSGGSSLAALKERHGFMDDNSLTEEKIVRWIRLYREKEGKWPGLLSKTVWDHDEAGNWIEVKESWTAINAALTHGLRSLPGGSSLDKLKKKILDGFYPDAPQRPSNQNETSPKTPSEPST